MAHIKKITFATVGQNEGCTCDRCGQYIKNIWTVQFAEGLTMNYGIDCFEKLCKTGHLSDYGKKLMKKSLKSISNIYLRMQEQAEMTETTDISWQVKQMDKTDAWYGEPYEEYKRWMLEEFWTYRLEKENENIEKFKNVNFKE